MSRFPPIAPADLQGDQKEAYDDIDATTKAYFGDKFIIKRSDGAFIGPLAVFNYDSKSAHAYFALLQSLAQLPGLSKAAREVSILVTGHQWNAAYETYAHERVAEADTELSREQIDAVKVGKKPEGLDEDCDVAFDVTMELLKVRKGRLGDEMWERAEKVLGKMGALALVHFVGFYSYTAVLINGCDVPLPEGESIR